MADVLVATEAPAGTGRPVGTDVLVAADGLVKVYGTVAPTVALDGLSIAIERGEFMALIGQSGSGKSTLLNLLGLLDTPTKGTVFIDGRDTSVVGKRERAALRNASIGFIFQFHHLLPEFSVWENMVMPTLIARGRVDQEARGRAEETLSVLGLEGLEKKNANELSGGQKQRVAIGRALMNRPPLVLADEPTGNLDTTNTEAVYGLFRKINEEWGTTFLIVTHDRRIAQQTDRILEISDGRLIGDERNLAVAAAS